MMKKKLKYIIGATLLFTAFNLKAQDIPKELMGVYTSKPSNKFSDEFNGNRNNNIFDVKKWHYRASTKDGLGQGPEYVQEKDGKLICFGLKDQRKSGALVSNDYFQFGWYAFKWKTTGIYHNKRNAWHPSVWGSLDDTHGNNVPRTTGKESNWMEIDIMEFSTGGGENTDWSSDAPAYLWVDSLKQKVKVNIEPGPSFSWKKAIMIDGKTDKYKEEVIGAKGHGNWQTLAMEYHPDYMQMWKLDKDTWVRIGNKVTFTDNTIPPTLRTVPRKAVKPLYWYVGSLFFTYGKTPIREDQITNSTFEVDWFHYHPIKKRSLK